MPDDAALRNLDKVEHIVVLMMENRSFDHMLGYLKLDGVLPEVDGLEPDMGDVDFAGVRHTVEPIGARMLHEKVLDPGHGTGDVDRQLDPNIGFVRAYEMALEENRKRHPHPSGIDFDPSRILGYQTADDVPVYDFMAREFTVCDRWFSSFPGPTWPNRLYALTGGTSAPVPPRIAGKVPKALRGLPIYERKAFVRHLDEDDWRWYSHDPALLRLADARYRPGGERGHGNDKNFAYFNRKTLFERRTFIDDAANGDLPKLAWIDPNFVDFRLYGPPGSNDDHPPSRVLLGQELVLTILHALASNEETWRRTLLLVTYDEHGGFFDHVDPRGFPIPGDPEKQYGLRVPALVVSPYAPRAVSHAVFDHTSIPKTVLVKCAPDPEAALAAMGPRTAAARHLGELLTEDEPRPAPELDGLIDTLRRKKQLVYDIEAPTKAEQAFEALTDLQQDVVFTALEMRAGDRHPPGAP